MCIRLSITTVTNCIYHVIYHVGHFQSSKQSPSVFFRSLPNCPNMNVVAKSEQNIYNRTKYFSDQTKTDQKWRRTLSAFFFFT